MWKNKQWFSLVNNPTMKQQNLLFYFIEIRLQSWTDISYRYMFITTIRSMAPIWTDHLEISTIAIVKDYSRFLWTISGSSALFAYRKLKKVSFSYKKMERLFLYFSRLFDHYSSHTMVMMVRWWFGMIRSGALPTLPRVKETRFWGQKNISYRKHQNHDFHVERSFDGGKWSSSGIKKHFP